MNPLSKVVATVVTTGVLPLAGEMRLLQEEGRTQRVSTDRAARIMRHTLGARFNSLMVRRATHLPAANGDGRVLNARPLRTRELDPRRQSPRQCL
jgi:hypothetical protein